MRLFSASFFLLPLLLFSDANALDLRIETTRRASCKRKTQPGDRIQVHYVGKLAADGTQFGSSFDTNQPFEFQLGTGRVIEGYGCIVHNIIRTACAPLANFLGV